MVSHEAFYTLQPTSRGKPYNLVEVLPDLPQLGWRPGHQPGLFA